MRNDFAVFIITHGRPDKQLTYDTLRRCGYNGKIYLVVDNTDNTIQQHIDKYGAENIIVFDKNHYINSDRFDNGTEGVFACAVYARRAVEDIAKSMKLAYFCMIDDDVTDLCLRIPLENKVRRLKIYNMDEIFNAYLELLEIKQISCLGFGYQTLYFSGMKYFTTDFRPLPFRLFIRKTSVDIDWSNWYGEDEIAGYQSNIKGLLWTAIPLVMVTTSEEATGAMQTTYEQTTSFLRSIVELRYVPSQVVIATCTRGKKKGTQHLYRRNQDWFPKIISSTYKKEI
jgi:hypothetical protein